MNQRAAVFATTAFTLGLVLRLILCALAPRYGYTWDHLDNIGMGRTAARVGLLNVYSASRSDLAVVKSYVDGPAGVASPNPTAGAGGSVRAELAEGEAAAAVPPTAPTSSMSDRSILERTAVVLPNYPPWAMTLFFAQVRVLDLMIGESPVNTFASRLVMGSAPFAFELLTAAGLFLLARRLDTSAGLFAAALFWCAPTTAMNSGSWGQVDAFILAPAVFLVLWLIERRFVLAGIALGAAVLLKPQGLILAPIALFGLLLAVFATSRPIVSANAFRVYVAASLKLGGAAAALVVIGTLPWTLAHGADWIARSYVQSYLDLAPDTTCFAFNVWYLDALRLDDRIVFALDSTARLGGASKDTWGRLLLIAAGAVGGFACWRLALARSATARSSNEHEVERANAGVRGTLNVTRNGPPGVRRGAAPIQVSLARALTVFACLWLWSVFLLPTRSHERYIVYCVPFLVLMGVVWRSYRGALMIVLLLATAEQSWNLWLAGPPAGTLLPRLGTVAWTVRHEMEAETPSDASGPSIDDIAARVAARKDQLLREAPSRLPAYQAARARVFPWDLILTLLSIGSYLWAFALSLRR